MPKIKPTPDEEFKTNDFWSIFKAYHDSTDHFLTEHQIESYNYFVNNLIPTIVKQYNPIIIGDDFQSEINDFTRIIHINFGKTFTSRPIIHENNGLKSQLFPYSARVRNFSYNSALTVDISIDVTWSCGSGYSCVERKSKQLTKVSLGKLPTMIFSMICLFKRRQNMQPKDFGECEHENGGYFIINGSEKVVVAQERQAENRWYTFTVIPDKSYTLEIKTVNKVGFLPAKPYSVRYNDKGVVLVWSIFKNELPVAILFKAMGMTSDLSYCKYIFQPHETQLSSIFEKSVLAAQDICTQQEALEYLVKSYTITGMPKEMVISPEKKQEIIEKLLSEELFSHIPDGYMYKTIYLAFLVRKLLLFIVDKDEDTDRDSYKDKRVDGVGYLLGTLFRQHFTKMIKDLRNGIIKEISQQQPKNADEFLNIMNATNVYKLVRGATIENGLKFSLATGNWGPKNTSSKVGVAQVLSRLSYLATLSNLRRMQVPIDKTTKMIKPRKLHASQHGYVCPSECFDPETQILMWDGSSKRAGDIVVGDTLVDDLGNPTKVRTTCSGDKMMYDIIPDKTNFTKHRVTDNHILTLRIRQHKNIVKSTRTDRKYTHIVKYFNRTNNKYSEKHFVSFNDAEDFVNSFDDDDTIDITIEDYLKLDKNTKTHLVLYKLGCINWETKSVEMDPYLLGMWLGDGLSSGKGFALNYKTDHETLEYWEKWAEENNAIITKDERYRYTIVSKKNKEATAIKGVCNRIEEAPLKKYLRKYNLIDNKHIPNEYLTNDKETRLKIMAGLIDTDGSVRAKGREIRITQGPQNYRIINDAHTLAISLGFSCSVKHGRSQWTDEKSGEKKFSVYKELSITGAGIHEIPTLLPRKKLVEVTNETQLKRSKAFMGSSFQLNPAGIGPYVGWQLEDKRGRFSLADGLVSHNTPEGGSIGIVKNLAMSSTITIWQDPSSISTYLIEAGVNEITTATGFVFDKCIVFVNGSLFGFTDEMQAIVEKLRTLRRQGSLHIHTSIVPYYEKKEIRIFTDSGRLVRPLLIVTDGKLVLTKRHVELVNDKTIRWNDLLFGNYSLDPILKPCVEFVDAEEAETCLIAPHANSLKTKTLLQYTHCEIHPSLILGAVACNIPFANHNQSPRNTYQCLDLETPVLMAGGYHKAIKDIKVGEEVVTFDPKTMKTSNSKIINQYVRETEKPMFEIATISNRTIKATYDHKFMTSEGWKKVEEMKEGDLIGIHIYPEYASTEVERYLILDSEMVRETMKKEKELKSLNSNIKNLEKLGLLPLYSDHPKMPIIARMFGFILTDGSVGIYTKGCVCQVDFGSTDAAAEFEDDVACLGLNKVKITEGTREFNKYRNITFHTFNVNHSGILGVLMISLGMTHGKRSMTAMKPMPEWILNGSMMVKREFLGGLFGGDGCKIQNKINCSYNKNSISCAMFSNVKDINFEESLSTFMECVSNLLNEFKIRTLDLKREIAKYDASKVKIGVKMSDNGENLLTFFNTIGYRYDRTKLMDSAISCEYLRYKINNDSSRLNAKDIISQIIIKEKCIFVPIKSITSIPITTISDITTESENHSFFANSFSSSNSAMGKQAIGIYATNFASRIDTMSNILYYPMKQLISPKLSEFTNSRKMPSGQMVIVAIMSSSGFNQEDAMLVNKSAIDRGLFRSSFNRCYQVEERKTQLSGEEEKIMKPSMHNTLGMKHGSYANLKENGLPIVGSKVDGGDVIIGKVIPRKFANSGLTEEKPFKDSSVTVRNSEQGYVSSVYESTNSDGYRFCKVILRNPRIPQIGDKFSATHGQKGTIGMVYNQEDMPVNEDGISPDIIINPHAIPSRMTCAMLMEVIMGHLCCHMGMDGDGTPFNNVTIESLSKMLESQGLNPHGEQTLYNGKTGKKLNVSIFMGPCYYQRLKHMVDDKSHSRAEGPVVMLTRQPSEGRSRHGGFRLGEMERDCLVSHGLAQFLKCRFVDNSDNWKMHISRSCGIICGVNEKSRKIVTFDENFEYDEVRTPYCMKLLIQELSAMGIYPKVFVDQ